MKCPGCEGKGYHHDEYRGIYECDLCGGVGRLEVLDLPDVPSVLTGKTPTEEHNEWDALRTAARQPKR